MAIIICLFFLIITVGIILFANVACDIPITATELLRNFNTEIENINNERSYSIS